MLTITPDSRKCYAGFASECNFSVLDIDSTSPTFGGEILKFDCLRFLPQLSPDVCYEERSFPKELAEISISPQDQNIVLLNVRRYELICLNVSNCSSTLMVSPKNTAQVIASSSFNYNGKLVLANSENVLNVWSSETGSLMHTINIHSTTDYPFPVAVSRSKNLVATGSTIHTAVRVWDLDKAEIRSASSLKVYENPVDCLTCSPETRLVFVKSYFGLTSSTKGYKFIDYFGIDAWNISTGSWRTCLPFGKYGRLYKMEVSTDGNLMALLLNAICQWYVVILNLYTKKVVCSAAHEQGWTCNDFTISSSWGFMATSASWSFENEIILWDLRRGQNLVCFHEAKSPVFHVGQPVPSLHRRRS